MDETRYSEDTTSESVAEQTNFGRYLALALVAVWLVTMVALVGQTHVH
jgi:CHASE3 domain sensor protein